MKSSLVLLSVVGIISTIGCTKAVDRVDLIDQRIQILDSSTKREIKNVTLKVDSTVVGTTEDKLAFVLITDFVDTTDNNKKVGTTSINGIVRNLLGQDSKSVTLSLSHSEYQTVSIPVVIKKGKYSFGDSVWFSSKYIPGNVTFMIDNIKGEWLPNRQQINIYMNPK